MTTVLEAVGLSARYGTSKSVIRDVDLAVSTGEVVALLGANGAGKTTTLLALAGVLPAATGRVELFGALATGPLHQRARRGLAFATEDKCIFRGLTVAENLRIGRCDAEAALDLFPELRTRLRLRAGLLSGGEQQMLVLARALARTPKVLLADELSLGLGPIVVTRLFEAVRKAAAEHDTGVLLVEQHVHKVLHYVDRVYVIRRGEIAFTGTAVEMRGRIDEITDTYLSPH